MASWNVLLTVALVFLIGIEVGHLMASGPVLGGPLLGRLRAADGPSGGTAAGAVAGQAAGPAAAPGWQAQAPEADAVVTPPPPIVATPPPPPPPPAAPGVNKAVAAGGPLQLVPGSRPSLVLIGGAKCGSSDAWVYLMSRFDLEPGRSGNSKVKEMWCLVKEDHKSMRRCFDDMYSQAPADKFTVDGTPTYIHMYDRHTQHLGNNEFAPMNMAYAAPDAAAVALIRNPVKRSRSEYGWNMHANGGLFAPLQARDINQQLEVELEYLTGGQTKPLMDLLFQEVDAVDAHKVFDAYRKLLDGYHVWLAKSPEKCRRVSKHDLDSIGQYKIPWCKTWPILIPSFWYPQLLVWRSVVFKPGRAAVVQSEAYYARKGILDKLIPLRPKAEVPPAKHNANKQTYHPGDSTISPQNMERLNGFFRLPNQRLRELLRVLPAEGVTVLPSVDEPGSWWQDR